jgi:uncharacterized protein
VRLLACIATSAILIASAAAGALPSRPEGPVLDLGEVFPAADETALNYRLARYYETSGNSLIVATVASLDDQPIEDYGTRLFKEWRIGDAATQHGILVLLAPSERQAWIGIGCGFGERMTNGFVEDVMQTKMIPEYKQRHFEEGTLAAVDALINRLASAPPNDHGSASTACRDGLQRAS